MFCRKCGKQVDENDLFCWNCGAEIARRDLSPQQSQEPASGQNAAFAQEPVAAREAVPNKPVQEKEPGQEKRAAAAQIYGAAAQEAAPIYGEVPAQEAAGGTDPQPAQMYGPAGNTQNVPVEGMASAAYSGKVVNVSQETEEYDYRKLPTEKPTGIRSIYFVDFLLRLTGKSNIALCIYLVLNLILISLFSMAFFALPVGWGIVTALLLYIASLSIAVSPIGEFILRRQTGCVKIQEAAVINRLEPLFREVYYKAKKGNPMISNDVRLFINDDECPNAFATGRRTICVTRGLLQWSDEEIKAALGHEFGHLAHKDTDRILVISIGNTVVAGLCYLFQIAAIITDVIIGIISAFMKDDSGFFVRMISALSRLLTIKLISLFERVWTQIGVLLCMKTSRDNEYLADEFSFNLGYGNALCRLLSTLPSEKPKGLFANLASSHPQSEARVARLQELGATYGREV